MRGVFPNVGRAIGSVLVLTVALAAAQDDPFAVDPDPLSPPAKTAPRASQDPPLPPTAPASAARTLGPPATVGSEVPVSLFMLVRVAKDLPAEDLKETLEFGAIKANCKYDLLRVDPIPPLVYQEFEALATDVQRSPEALAEKGLSIRPLRASDEFWQLNLEHGAQVLKSLKVKYKDSGEQVYTPENPKDAAQADLVLIVPGSYALRMKRNDVPQTYTATVSDLTQGAKEKTLEGSWPEEDRYYVITLKNFVGDRQRLFDMIKEHDDKPNEVPNPLSDVEVGRDLSFVFASLGSKLSRPTLPFDKNKYVPEIAGLERREVKRVWMYFPLKESEVEAAVKKYSAYRGADLSNAIREESPVGAEAAAELFVAAESQPRWIELPKNERGSFSREIELQDFEKLSQAYPKVHRLVVWEFEDDNPNPSQRIPTAAIAFDHPQAGGRVYVLPEEIKAWPEGLQKLIQETGPAAGEGGAPAPPAASGADNP